MPNSLKSQIKKLAFQGKITKEEATEMLNKIDGHDKEIIRKFSRCKNYNSDCDNADICPCLNYTVNDTVSDQEKLSRLQKFINRELYKSKDCSSEYYQGLHRAYKDINDFIESGYESDEDEEN